MASPRRHAPRYGGWGHVPCARPDIAPQAHATCSRFRPVSASATVCLQWRAAMYVPPAISGVEAHRSHRDGWTSSSQAASHGPVCVCWYRSTVVRHPGCVIVGLGYSWATACDS